MRSHAMTWAALAAVLWLGTGASSEGVGRAREWQRQGDIALAGGLWEIAYDRYAQLAEVFPDTPHGKRAEGRARALRKRLLWPARSAAEEDLFAWTDEVRDFLTWP